MHWCSTGRVEVHHQRNTAFFPTTHIAACSSPWEMSPRPLIPLTHRLFSHLLPCGEWDHGRAIPLALFRSVSSGRTGRAGRAGATSLVIPAITTTSIMPNRAEIPRLIGIHTLILRPSLSGALSQYMTSIVGSRHNVSLRAISFIHIVQGNISTFTALHSTSNFTPETHQPLLYPVGISATI